MPKELFPCRYRDPLTAKWVRARYLAERREIADRYKEWEIVGPPEIRESGTWGAGLQPYRDTQKPKPIDGPELHPHQQGSLDRAERYLARLFLRRYVTYCARPGRFAQAGGAASLWSELG